MTLPARSILITGATSGIGLCAARTMAARGWRVFATYRETSGRETSGREILAAIDGVTPLVLNYADPASVAATAAAVLEATEGRLGALYNNGAGALPGALEDISRDDLRALFEVNVFGWHDLTARLVPAMRAAGGGRVVFCSSVLGFMSMPYRGAYSLTKYAVEAMADSWRLELAPSGIHVSAIEPGPIRTDFVRKSIAAFAGAIDAEASVFRDDYRRRLAAMASAKPSLVSRPPEAVVRCLVHACESPRPKPVYRVTPATTLAAAAKRLLPTSLFVAFSRLAARLER